MGYASMPATPIHQLQLHLPQDLQTANSAAKYPPARGWQDGTGATTRAPARARVRVRARSVSDFGGKPNTGSGAHAGSRAGRGRAAAVVNKKGSSGNPVGGRNQGSECNDDCRRIPASSHGASSAGGRMTRRVSGGARPPCGTANAPAKCHQPHESVARGTLACAQSRQASPNRRDTIDRVHSACALRRQFCSRPAKRPRGAPLPAPPGAAGIRSVITHSIPGRTTKNPCLFFPAGVRIDSILACSPYQFLSMFSAIEIRCYFS